MSAWTFALCSQTERVSGSELFLMSAALEQNAADCADAWGLQRPAVTVVDDIGEIRPSLKLHTVVLVDEGGPSGTLAHHGWDPFKEVTVSRVFVHRSSGLKDGPYSVSESCGHEITEALVNPLLNEWVDHPRLPGVQMAKEVADMVQDTYNVESDGIKWRVANFVYPAYFDKRLVDEAERNTFRREGGRFDHKGTLFEPGSIGPEGYAIHRMVRPLGGWRTYPVYGSRGLDAARQTAKQHHGSRTRKLGVFV